MASIDNLSLIGKRVIVRVDFNVPLNDQFEIKDDTRILESLPTLNKILAEGASLIIMSHLGRPKPGVFEEKFSLKHLIPYLSKIFNREVLFATDCVGEDAENKAANLKPGEILLLENLRFHEGETKGNKEFAQRLAKLADVYINDAFGTAHRAHASTAIIAEFFKEKAFGYLMNREVENLNKVIANPEKPFVAVMGGAKVSDKIKIIENLIDKVDYLLLGGGMIFSFIYAKGGKIGKSLCEQDMVQTCLDLMAKAESKGVKILIPVDVYSNSEFSNDGERVLSASGEIADGLMGLDIGPKSVEMFKEVLLNAKTILWNGPMGVFEFDNFQQGTKDIAHCIAEATHKGSYSLVGGGDSLAALAKFNLKDKVSYVSTGGGAMLEYLEGKILPGIEAMEK